MSNSPAETVADRISVVSVTHLPVAPQAGETFVMIVEVNREVTTADEPVFVDLEKQRIVPVGGAPAARPTGGYFEPDRGPVPIPIAVGSKYAVSKPIVVWKDARAEDGEVPVNFPETLLMTAYIGDLRDGFRNDLIRVQRPSTPAELFFAAGDLTLGQMVPNKSEKDVVGAATSKIVRGTPEFNALADNQNPDIIFKDEEHTGADRRMTTKVKQKVDALAATVKSEWPGLKLRITEAWDENDEHGTNSVHYEGRGVDLTTSDQDGSKLGRLGRLAVDAGFEWVFFEDPSHIHASMSK